MALLCSQPQFAVTEKTARCTKRKAIQISGSYDIDITSLEKENKEVRAAMLKKRFANVIFKSKLVLGKLYDEEPMKKQKDVRENQLLEEKEKLKYLQRQKEREAARIAIGSVKRTVDFDDNLIAEREILIMIGKKFDKERESQVWEEIKKAKLKLQLQREREAARIAIESIKRTVDFGDSLKAEKEFLKLIGAA